ncbi:MAG: aminoglycoside phosphotransferase [Alphaproteobacteria bacterium]|nr:aminoglycoside phosphotransferase [Alphaproteobacteria bacterium]
MPEHEAAIAAFLTAAGFGRARRRPLAGDASSRRYERLTLPGGRRALLMDASAARASVPPFLRVQALLAARGYSVPEIYAAAPDAGLVVVEDFGERGFARRAADPAWADALYGAAVDVLLDLGRCPAIDVPAYDDACVIEEVERFLLWYVPALTGRPALTLASEAFVALWQELLPQARFGGEILVLRDFHADNLFWLPDRPGLNRVGLIDFQDAVIGPPAYDLVSLLEDVRHIVPSDVAARMRARYVAGSGLDPEAFAASAAILGAQRTTKIIGLFTRLLVRDSKPRYLAMIPRAWQILEANLEHPALAELKRWFARTVPHEHRHRVPSLAA